MRRTPQGRPQGRKDLIIRDVKDEAVVYDFANHRAHCMNRLAVAVFRRCDGNVDVPQLAALLTKDMGEPVSKDLIWMALSELSSARLLDGKFEMPKVDFRRRRLLKKIALTAGLSVAFPAVWSIVAPTPAYAASRVSCVSGGSCKTPNANQCCGAPGSPAMSCTGPGMCNGNGSACQGAICQ